MPLATPTFIRAAAAAIIAAVILASRGISARPTAAGATVAARRGGGRATSRVFPALVATGGRRGGGRRPPPIATGAATTATATATRLASSLGSEPPPPEDADRLKWERMYEEGERAREAAMAENLFGESEDLDPDSLSRSELRVVTFDLDNTLWRTGEVISAANDALSEYLRERGVAAPVRTEVVMGELFRRNGARYCPRMEAEEIVGANGDGAGDGGVDNVGKSNIYIQSGSHKPVLLTQLRKDAIRDILARHNGYSESDADDFAEEAFGVWTAARHEAIPHHMAGSVLDVFRTIRSLRTSAGRPPVVGAVTDGNSDPRSVPGLGEHFDFVVNAESVGVAKPDRRVYYAAVAEAASCPALADLFPPADGGDGSPPAAVDADGAVNEDVVEDVLGPWWCHVGDDFIKDCVAAKELGMRSVWCRELVLPSKEEPAASGGESESTEAKKKRDVADLVKELAEMKVVEMSIGAEDFLADSIHREFTDAILDRFSDLGKVLANWHEEGLGAAATNEGMDVVSEKVSERDTEAIGDILEVVVPDDPPERKTSAAQSSSINEPAVEEKESQPQRDAKFCMYCGANLPLQARFCSSCGEKQPDLVG